MRHLTLGDLRLGLKDILETHAEELVLSVAGKLYQPLLSKKRAEIEAQPEPRVHGAAFVAELAEADAHHDALGAAVFYLTQAVLIHPTLDEATKEIAMRAQRAFVPELGVLAARYVDEAAHAHRKRDAFDSLRPELEQFVAPGGANLGDWVASFLDHGDRIGALLQARAEIGATAVAPVDGGALKSSTIGLLGRFRQAIRDEVAMGADLPKGYEDRLFAFLDQLDRSRVDAKKRRAAGRHAPAEAASPAENCEPDPSLDDA